MSCPTVDDGHAGGLDVVLFGDVPSTPVSLQSLCVSDFFSSVWLEATDEGSFKMWFSFGVHDSLDSRRTGLRWIGGLKEV